MRCSSGASPRFAAGVAALVLLAASGTVSGLELRASSVARKMQMLRHSKFAPAGDGWSHTIPECMGKAKEFLGDAQHPNGGSGPITSLHAIEMAVDACAHAHLKDSNNYVCTHYRKFLDHAFHRFPQDKTVTVKSWCTETENHALSMQQQVMKLEDDAGAKQDILNFKIADRCPPALAEAIAPKKALPKEQVPDFWYAYCVSQDCAHYLPSRTRWCNVNLAHPRHTIEVCQMARQYAIRDMASYPEDKVPPKDICEIYNGYVQEARLTLEAYEHVLYGAPRDKIPVPKDPERALTSSQLMGGAAGHHIRDHGAHKVTPFTETKEEPYYHAGASSAKPVAVFFGLLAAVRFTAF